MKLRWEIVVLMSAQGQRAPDIAQLLAVARRFDPIDQISTSGLHCPRGKSLKRGGERMKRLMLLVLGLAAALVFVPSAA
ncbi:MAG TPA: hypothetical protein VKD66_14690, partial [Streptosporangiaceae bacterium]|nr:hypothetical protein [Streptosporangiaceae bacterium]